MKQNFIIAFDVGGTNLKSALLDSANNIIDSSSTSTSDFKSKDSLIHAIVNQASGIKSRNKLNNQRILGVGVGLPGPVDFKNGVVYSLTNIPGWRDVPLKKLLRKKLGLDVFVDNDAKLMAMAEFHAGAAKGANTAVCITLGTGVGGGLIIDGRLHRGFNNAAGELGHMPLNEAGAKCNCGSYACLETYIGNKVIMGKAKNAFGRQVSLEELSRMSKADNGIAKKIWRDSGRQLGIVLSGIVNLLNPDCIVIGGGVSNAGKVLFDEVRRTVKDRAMVVQARHVKVIKAMLGNDAGLIGAGILVKQSLMKRN
ncbi:MAG: ROK family protein [Candidatus Omnitrophota bacterium]|jgi:glucokinase|nr:MAG: ROK family protein [Candidatus Omnitrophota bacterium]